jgi:hypothetical protein
VEIAFTSYWTLWPLRFETERAQRRVPGMPKLLVSAELPPTPLPAGRTVAFAPQRGTPAFNRVKHVIRTRGIAHERSEWGDYVIFSGIDSSWAHVGTGFPERFVGGALPPPPRVLDSFN